MHLSVQRCTWTCFSSTALAALTRTVLLRTVASLMLLLVLSGMPPGVFAQQTDSNPSVVNNPGEVLQAPEKVDVKPIARDEEIEDRLSSILQATGWFVGAEVQVEEGVVFLTGTADRSEHRQWAADLAGKTQDVAAVVNNISVSEKSIWDFSDTIGELQEMQGNLIRSTPFLLFGLLTIFLTWVLARLVRAIAPRALQMQISNSLLRWVAVQLMVLPIYLLGLYMVLRVAGLTQLALTVLGGTGLLGLIIGIAFQDIAENFLASILISLQAPFRLGDLVRVGEHEGVVQRVTTRGTTLMTVDGNHVQIPNSQIYKQTIENYTANPLRRVSFDIGIGYDDSTTEAQNIVLQTILHHSATLNDPDPRVLIESLGASTVNLRALFWIDGTTNDLPAVKSSCLRMTKQALTKAGISMPDEAREILFPQGVPVQISDRQVPPQPAAESPQKVSPQKTEVDRSEAEGNMTSEIDELNRQAAASWSPGSDEDELVIAD